MNLKDLLGGATVQGKDMVSPVIDPKPEHVALLPRRPYEAQNKPLPILEVAILTVSIINTLFLFAIYQLIKTL